MKRKLKIEWREIVRKAFIPHQSQNGFLFNRILYTCALSSLPLSALNKMSTTVQEWSQVDISKLDYDSLKSYKQLSYLHNYNWKKKTFFSQVHILTRSKLVKLNENCYFVCFIMEWRGKCAIGTIHVKVKRFAILISSNFTFSSVVILEQKKTNNNNNCIITTNTTNTS